MCCFPRYGCDGQQQQNRTANYFEYPATVAMLLREVRYGISLTPGNVTVAPFLEEPAVFTFDIGNVFVQYSEQRVSIEVPGQDSSSRGYRVEGLVPSSNYTLSFEHGRTQHSDTVLSANSGTIRGSSAVVSSDAEGVVRFEGPASSRVTLELA